MRKPISDSGQPSPTRRRRSFAEKRVAGSLGRGHFVYIVECADGSLYTGYTTDPRRRLAEHNSGTASRYTRPRRPVKLVYLERLGAKGAALSRELRVKRMKKEEKLLLCRTFSGTEKPGSR